MVAFEVSKTHPRTSISGFDLQMRMGRVADQCHACLLATMTIVDYLPETVIDPPVVLVMGFVTAI